MFWGAATAAGWRVCRYRIGIACDRMADGVGRLEIDCSLVTMPSSVSPIRDGEFRCVSSENIPGSEGST